MKEEDFVNAIHKDDRFEWTYGCNCDGTYGVFVHNRADDITTHFTIDVINLYNFSDLIKSMGVI